MQKHPNYISTQDLANHLGVSSVAVWKRIQAGKIDAVKIGRSYAISAQYIQKHFPDFPLKDQDQEYVSLIEAGQMLGVSRETIRLKIKKGELQAYKVGRHFVIAKDQILKQQSQQLNIATYIEGENLSIPQVAQMLGISRIAVFKQVKKGLIKATKVGRHYSIHRSAILPEQQKPKQSTQSTQQYISVADYAKQLGVSRIAVFKQIKNGAIKAIKIGRSYAILHRDERYKGPKKKC